MLSMQKVCERIDCTDARTAEKWCRNNDVTIHIEERKKYVLNVDLDRVMGMKYIESLKKLYPSDYEEVYYASIENDLISLHRTISTTTEAMNEDYTYEANSSFDDYQDDKWSSDFLKKYKD